MGDTAGSIRHRLRVATRPGEKSSILDPRSRRVAAGVHLLLIGDGPTRRELESLTARLGLTDRVHFAGEVISQTNLHQFFEVSALDSRSKGFPNAIVEALGGTRGCRDARRRNSGSR